MSCTISSMADPSLLPLVVCNTVTPAGRSPDDCSAAMDSTLSESTPIFTPVPSTP